MLGFVKVRSMSISLFDQIVKSTIFINREALQSTYIPNKLPHRENELRRIGEILAPALNLELPSNILVYGKTGTGKTACVRFVGREIERAGGEKNLSSVIYINCGMIDTPYSVLAKVAFHLGMAVPPTGWSMDRVYDEIVKGMDGKRRVVITILDEIDKLAKKEDGALYKLSRMNSDLADKGMESRMCLIGISNDLKFREYLDPRISSSLSSEEIMFQPYRANQLRDILWERAKEAFREGAVSEDVISLVAAIAAGEHGDARRALDLLRVGGEIAERSGDTVVREEHIRAAREKLESNKIMEFVSGLPLQQKLTLYAILTLEKRRRESNPIRTGDVYEVYKKLCRKVPGIEHLTSRRITEFISDFDINGIIVASVKSRGREGRSKEIKLIASVEDVERALLEDSIIRTLAEEKYIQTTLQFQ